MERSVQAGGKDLNKGLMNVGGKSRKKKWEEKNTNQCFLLCSYPFGFNFFSGEEEEEGKKRRGGKKKSSALSVASV